jgi:hypothetical protein
MIVSVRASIAIMEINILDFFIKYPPFFDIIFLSIQTVEVRQAIPQLSASKEHFSIGKSYKFLYLPFRVDFIETKNKTSKKRNNSLEAKYWQFLINPFHGKPQKLRVMLTG